MSQTTPDISQMNPMYVDAPSGSYQASKLNRIFFTNSSIAPCSFKRRREIHSEDLDGEDIAESPPRPQAAAQTLPTPDLMSSWIRYKQQFATNNAWYMDVDVNRSRIWFSKNDDGTVYAALSSEDLYTCDNSGKLTWEELGLWQVKPHAVGQRGIPHWSLAYGVPTPEHLQPFLLATLELELNRAASRTNGRLEFWIEASEQHIWTLQVGSPSWAIIHQLRCLLCHWTGTHYPAEQFQKPSSFSLLDHTVGQHVFFPYPHLTSHVPADAGAKGRPYMQWTAWNEVVAAARGNPRFCVAK